MDLDPQIGLSDRGSQGYPQNTPKMTLFWGHFGVKTGVQNGVQAI